MTEQMTDIEVVDPTSQEVAQNTEVYTAPTTPALQRMAAEAQALDTAFKMAQSLSKTNAVPQRYQQSFVPSGQREPQGITAAYDLAAAILYGAELGMSALQSAQNVFSVHGQPAVYSKTMVAQVLRHIDTQGTGGPNGDGVWEVSATKDKVVWAGRRDGKTAAAEWTIARAESAGFTRNPMYAKMPVEMLRAKAQAEVCRILWPDVLLGMSNSVEELQLADGTVVQRVTSQRPTKAKGVAGLLANVAPAIEQHPAEPGPADQSVTQAPIPEQAPIPNGDNAVVVEDPAPAAGEEAPAAGAEPEKPALVSKRQLTEVKRALAKESYTDPKSEETLTYVNQLVGVEITDLADLTESKAAELLSILSEPINTDDKENSK
ncbi:RecT-like ssDNA binding protein [Mycobacterium phage Typha]|uniref:RecT-like ssDNA binding protein n=1 Tax=Mycobacterium phage Typha TaxID=2517971 RepID=A0A482JCM2_9CAUD|nr:RecT-like ssDNA annealing protein [Mycobacterium phage Typha]QBP29721.1 RecT-like ssDNA binding protein [Mycobacterium phage Typha]